MGRVIVLTAVIFALMIKPLLNQELDFGVYSEKPNVVVEAAETDDLMTGFELWFYGDASQDDGQIGASSSENTATEIGLDEWEIEQQNWEDEMMESGLLGC